MLTFILIGGLAWLAVALVFVLALAAAARKQVSPVAVTSLTEPFGQEKSEPAPSSDTPSAIREHPANVEEPVAS